MTALEILKKARAKIRSPKRWVQGTIAETAKKRGTNAKSPRAVRWCAFGALCVSTPRHHVFDREGAYQVLCMMAPGRSIIEFNDRKTTTHEKILAVFDKAIARLEKKLGKKARK